MVLAVTEASVACRNENNDEYGALNAARTIYRSSGSVVFLGRPLPSWCFVRPWFTHFCQDRLIVASLLSTCRTFRRLDQLISLSSITSPLSNADICAYCSRTCVPGIVIVYMRTLIQRFYDSESKFLLFNILPVAQLKCSAASHVRSLVAKLTNLCPIGITPSWCVIFFVWECTSMTY